MSRFLSRMSMLLALLMIVSLLAACGGGGDDDDDDATATSAGPGNGRLCQPPDPALHGGGQHRKLALETATQAGHQRDQRPVRPPIPPGKGGDLGRGVWILGDLHAVFHRKDMGTRRRAAIPLQIAFVTAPVTPAQAPAFSSSPRMRSGLVGGGIPTPSSLRNPKRP